MRETQTGATDANGVTSDRWHFCYYIEHPPPPEVPMQTGGECGNCIRAMIAYAWVDPERLVFFSGVNEGEPLINLIHLAGPRWLQTLRDTDMVTARELERMLNTTRPIADPPREPVALQGMRRYYQTDAMLRYGNYSLNEYMNAMEFKPGWSPF